MAGRKGRCDCGAIIQIPHNRTTASTAPTAPKPATPATPKSAAVAPTPTPAPNASLFDELTDDDWQADVPLEPVAAAPARQSEKDVLAQYTKNSSLTSRRSKSSGDFFGPEKAGIDYGIVGGVALMGIATLWFIGGLAVGLIFFYPPILFLIGLFGFIRGLITGNIAGK